MRFLLALALLASCAPPAPQVELARARPESPRIRYDCSPAGEVSMVYVTHDGEALEPEPTGRRCNYAAWIADGGPSREGW